MTPDECADELARITLEAHGMTDIIERLRQTYTVGHDTVCNEAADEIERLRAKKNDRDERWNGLVERRMAEIERLRGENENLSHHNEAYQSQVENQQAEIERLRAELAPLRQLFVKGIQEFGKPATAFEASHGFESVRKRAKECERLGLVKVVGKRRCTVNHTICQIYEATG